MSGTETPKDHRYDMTSPTDIDINMNHVSTAQTVIIGNYSLCLKSITNRLIQMYKGHLDSRDTTESTVWDLCDFVKLQVMSLCSVLQNLKERMLVLSAIMEDIHRQTEEDLSPKRHITHITIPSKSAENIVEGLQNGHWGRLQPTEVVGKIEFIGYYGTSKYARLGVSTDMKTVGDLLKDWRINQPELVLSVTGGSKNFFMPNKLIEAFKRGLHKISKHTATCVVTAGTRYGVAKLTGQAVRDSRLARSTEKAVVKPVVAIGITTWGCIKDREKLVNNGRKQLANKRKDGRLIEKYTAHYDARKESGLKKERNLDPHHTHFLLMDNGPSGSHPYNPMIEINFRVKVEQEIAYLRANTPDKTKIPIVLLVLEGGENTLLTVLEELRNGTPVVVVEILRIILKGVTGVACGADYAHPSGAPDLSSGAPDLTSRVIMEVHAIPSTYKIASTLTVTCLMEWNLFYGSGRIADILAYAVKNHEDVLKEEATEEHRNERAVKDIIKTELKNSLPSKSTEQLFEYVKNCMEHHELITVFDGEDISSDIDYGILDALLLKKKNDDISYGYDQIHMDYDQLKLAMAWDRLDDTRKERLSRVTKDSLKTEHGAVKIYSEMLLPAICLDRPKFVKLIFENGANPKKFLDFVSLEKIFIESNCDPVCKSWSTMADVVNQLESLGEFCVPAYMKTLPTNQGKSSMPTVSGSFGLTDIPVHSPGRKIACQILFIWSLLLNRQELAKIFWNEGKNGIANAIVAYGLLNAIADVTTDIEEKKLLKQNAEEFNSLALGVLSLCFEKNEIKTEKILTRIQHQWEANINIMGIAYRTRNKTFINHIACKFLFMNQWMGKISNTTSTSMLMMSVFIPPVLLAIDYKKRRRTVCTNLHTVTNQRGSNNKSMETADDEKQMTGSRNKDGHSCIDKIYHFYTAPWTVAAFNIISYIMFLTLFAYLLLVDIGKDFIVVDIVLMVWVLSMFTEELRQCFTHNAKGLGKKLLAYIHNDYNKVDLLKIFLFASGMVLRFVPWTHSLSASRVILGLSFLIFFMRILQIFTVNKQLGPWLVMIRRMTVNLFYFFMILMVFVVSYAIAAHAIAFPNSKLDGMLVYNVMRTGYWNVYGELFLEEIEVEEPKCSFNETIYSTDPETTRCPSEIGRYLVPILRGIYVLFSNILLLNLLISIFCNTYQSIQDRADIHWSFERYELIREYRTRPSLPAPFIIVRHLSMFIIWILKCCFKCCIGISEDIAPRCKVCKGDCPTKQKKTDERTTVDWEKVMMITFIEKKYEQENECLRNQVQEGGERVSKLIEKVDSLLTNQKMNEDVIRNMVRSVNAGRKHEDDFCGNALNNSQVHVNSRIEI